MFKALSLCLVCLCFACVGCAADGHRVDRHPDSSDWTPLFAGDLSNASAPDGVWSVEDGELTASADRVIWTNDSYDNFVLDLEFKVGSNANSGVIVYCSNPGRWIPNSVEVQILDDGGDRWADVPNNQRCGAIFGHVGPSERVSRPAGEWNRMTITCVGPRIDVTLNGSHVTTIDMTEFTSAQTNPDGTPIPSWLSTPAAELATQGQIGLQGKHGGAPIWFRNIRIRELGE